MTLTLTLEQTEQVRAMLQPGLAVLGRVSWRPFAIAGEESTLILELGTVPENSLPALRTAIREANGATTKRKRKSKR